jgi:hypothetical protein
MGSAKRFALRVSSSAVRVGTGTAAGLCLLLLAGATGAAAQQLTARPLAPPTTAGARGDASGGTWGTAQEVPGTASLNKGGSAGISSMSCASAGNCGAGGYYTDSADNKLAFVVSEVDGTWGTAQEVPGLAALGASGDAMVTSISCPSAGNCSAGGQYAYQDTLQGFVVSEVNGTWGDAAEVPGLATLNAGGSASVGSVSCSSDGNCAAGGGYTDRSDDTSAFVVSETGGTWGDAEEVPGLATLNEGGHAGILSVSCGSGGGCSAGGTYETRESGYEAFIVSGSGGSWEDAEEVPGSAALNTGGDAEVISVSCAADGSCSAGGTYTDDKGIQAFIVSGSAGSWEDAEEVPGSAALNTGQDAQITSVSCVSGGNCSAGGEYTDTSSEYQPLVVSEVNGTWGTAQKIPGMSGVKASSATVGSVSCASAGNCSAGGSYESGGYAFWAFVVNEADGTWGNMEEVPGTAKLNRGDNAGVTSVSCTPDGGCGAGGAYTSALADGEAFVVNATSSCPQVISAAPDGEPPSNWAGYVAHLTASCGTTFTSVTGQWVQPTITCPTPEKGASTPTLETDFWVGLDGSPGRTNKTVEQTGIEIQCRWDATTSAYNARYRAWYEMYPLKPVYDQDGFSKLSPQPGTTITATVTFTSGAADPYDLSLTVRSATGSTTASTNQACPPGSTCQNLSAEWVTEKVAPFNLASFMSWNLADGFATTTANGSEQSVAALNSTADNIDNGQNVAYACDLDQAGFTVQQTACSS